MKAMIFAAGKGTRLQPLTHNLPKALVPFMGRPLLEHIVRKCIRFGITEIVINIHYLGEQVIDFLKQHHYFDIDIRISDERDKLLDTGGGLKKAAHLLEGDGPILIHNVDMVSDINFEELYIRHKNGGAVATLAAMVRTSNRRFLVNSEHLLCGWENVSTGERKMVFEISEPLIPASYCGIAIIESKFLSLIQQEGVFSLTDTFLQVAREHPVRIAFFENLRWVDVGTPEKLALAEKLFEQKA